MELWIRSQDKEELVKCERITFIDNILDSETISYRMLANNVYIGSYATKERALEVLDEIEKKLSGIEVTEITNKSGGNMNNIYPIIIYKMPER